MALQLDANGASKRLRAYGPGTVVGEMNLYTQSPRSDDIIANEDSRLIKLTTERVAARERDHSALALKLHRHSRPPTVGQ